MAVLIPRTNAPQVQVGSAPSARNTARMDTGFLQQGIAEIGDTAQRYFAQQVQIADDTALMEARNQLSTWEGSINDPSNPEGRNKYQGKNALDAGANLLPKADAEIARIRQTLTPRQAADFDRVAGNFRAQFHDGLNRWADREFTGYEDATFKATNENLVNDAVSAGMSGDWARQASVANELLAINRRHLSTRGMGEELIKANERGIVSGIHSGTLDGIMAADPLAAQAYYERWADQMTPTDRAKAQRALYPVLEDVQADSYAEAIMAGTAVQADDPDGVDDMIVGLESGGSDTAKNPDSSATGAGQFLSSTWLDVVRRHRPDVAAGKSEAEILALRTDGALAREMVAAYRRDNAAHLQANGIQTTAVNLYAAHHFGPAGGARFARASSNAPMSSILSQRELAANPYLQGKTVGEVKANWQARGLASGEGGKGAPPASESEALERAGQIRDPRLRAAVTRKIGERYRLQEMRERETSRAMSEQIFTTLESAENPNRPLRDLVGPEAYAWAVREGKTDAFEAMRMRRVQDTFVQDDPVLVEALSREAILSPNTFKERNLYELVDRLSTDSLKNFRTMQAEANNPSKRADWLTDAERVETGLTMLGLDTARDASGKGSDKANEPRQRMRGEFRIAYRNAEQAFIQSQGKNPTPEQADVLMRTVTKQFAQRQAVGTTGAYSSAASFQTQISEADRSAVRDAYRAKYGVPPTDAWVTNYIVQKRSSAQ